MKHGENVGTAPKNSTKRKFANRISGLRVWIIDIQGAWDRMRLPKCAKKRSYLHNASSLYYTFISINSK